MDAQSFEYLTPREFELQVKLFLDEQGARLTDFESGHLDRIESHDGIYEFDVTARFEALLVDFLVLIECKHYKNPVKRDVPMLLHAKMQSVGAHKGMVFSTAPYQSGAVDYAEKHGIALITINALHDLVVVNKCPAPPRAFDPERQDHPDPKFAGWMFLLRNTNRYRTVFEYLAAETPTELWTDRPDIADSKIKRNTFDVF